MVGCQGRRPSPGSRPLLASPQRGGNGSLDYVLFPTLRQRGRRENEEEEGGDDNPGQDRAREAF